MGEEKFRLELEQTMEASKNEGWVTLYPYASELFEEKDNAGGGDCMMYVLAHVFGISESANPVQFFRNNILEALNKYEHKFLRSHSENMPETNYQLLISFLEDIDQQKVVGNSYKEMWHYYLTKVIPTAGAWGNDLLWTAWLQNKDNPYANQDLYTLNCLIIDQLIPAKGMLSSVNCMSSQAKSKKFQFWFIVLRTKTDRGRSGFGRSGDHYVNLRLKGTKGILPSFPLIYTTEQINSKFGHYLRIIGVSSCLELVQT